MTILRGHLAFSRGLFALPSGKKKAFLLIFETFEVNRFCNKWHRFLEHYNVKAGTLFHSEVTVLSFNVFLKKRGSRHPVFSNGGDKGGFFLSAISSHKTFSDECLGSHNDEGRSEL